MFLQSSAFANKANSTIKFFITLLIFATLTITSSGIQIFAQSITSETSKIGDISSESIIKKDDVKSEKQEIVPENKEIKAENKKDNAPIGKMPVVAESKSADVSNKKQEIKDKKTVTAEGITAEIPAGTIITAGDGKDLLSN